MSTSIWLSVEDKQDLSAAREVAAAVDEKVTLQVPPSEPSDTYGPQVEPFTMVLLSAAGVAALAKFALDFWDRLRGGLVVDQSGSAVKLSRDKQVPSGYIVTIPPEGGKVTVDVTDAPKDAVERLLAALLEGQTSSVEDVVAKATEIGLSATTST